MPASKDAAKREIQLANLKQNSKVSNTHGAFSGRLIREATAEHAANLRTQLPTASSEEIAVQAQRMAMIDRLSEYVHARGLIADRRRGTTIPAADLLAKLSAQFERQHAVLLERERSAGVPPGESLADVVAEIEAAREAGCDG